jgi:hypothetical protein
MVVESEGSTALILKTAIAHDPEPVLSSNDDINIDCGRTFEVGIMFLFVVRVLSST